MLLTQFIPIVACLLNGALSADLNGIQNSGSGQDILQKISPVPTSDQSGQVQNVGQNTQSASSSISPSQVLLPTPTTQPQPINPAPTSQVNPPPPPPVSNPPVQNPPQPNPAPAPTPIATTTSASSSTSSTSSSAPPIVGVVTLNKNGFEGTIHFTLIQGQTSNTTKIQVTMKSVPEIQGQSPYPWHIHDKPVDSSGNCTSAAYHLDPFHLNPDGKNKEYKCNPNNFATCEVGDLAGKFGPLEPKNGSNLTFHDPTLEFSGPNNIIGRSVVIHLANSTRIVCGNITLASNSSTANTSSTKSSGVDAMALNVFLSLSLVALSTVYLI